jgi:hypothetical protein
LLEATDENAIRNAFGVLTQIHADIRMPVLQELARGGADAYVRERAVFALGQTGRGEVIPLLRELALADPDPDVRSAALTNLYFLEELRPMPKTGRIDLDVRGQIKEGNTITLAAHILSSKDAEVRVSIAKLPEQVRLVSETIQWKGQLRADERQELAFELLILDSGSFYIPVEMILNFGDRLDFEETQARVYLVIDDRGGQVITTSSPEFPDLEVVTVKIEDGE